MDSAHHFPAPDPAKEGHTYAGNGQLHQGSAQDNSASMEGRLPAEASAKAGGYAEPMEGRGAPSAPEPASPAPPLPRSDAPHHLTSMEGRGAPSAPEPAQHDFHDGAFSPRADSMASEEISERPGGGLSPGPAPAEIHATLSASLSASMEGRGAPPAPEPASPAPPLHRSDAPHDLAESLRRLDLLNLYTDLVDHGCGTRAAARQLGVSHVSLWRWSSKLEALRLDPSDATQRAAVLGALADPPCRGGRKSPWEFLLEQPEAGAKLDSLYLATLGASSEYMTHGRRTGSIALALLRFADEPECPDALGRELRRGAQPAPLVRHLRRITPELEARVRGSKHFALHGVVSRRDHTVRLPDQTRAKLVSGFLVELDDMSANQPFWAEGPGKNGTDCVLSRQGLYARDVHSGRWLGCELIARPREAYRAEDILRFLRRLMQAYGKFDILRLERGIWAARSICGVRITETGVAVEEKFERPGMDESEMARLSDGLRAIGIEIDYAYTAHQKIIESGFNYFQRVLATFTQDLVNIGRHAGEFEHGAKALRRVRAGSHHPQNLGFPSIDEMSERIAQTFAWINARPLHRHALTPSLRHTSELVGRGYAEPNTPDTTWQHDLCQRQLPSLTERDLAAFLPELRDLQIRGGRVTTTIDGQPFDFRSDTFIELGHGYRVSIRLDPSEPTLGCAVYNRETSSANHRGYRDGEFICFADWEVPGPQAEIETSRGLPVHTLAELYGPHAQDDGYDRRKAQLAFVRSRFVALPRPGQPAIRTSEERDGRGGLARVERSTQHSSDGGASSKRALPEPPTTNQRARFTEPSQDDLASLSPVRPKPARKSSYSISIEEMNEL